MAADAGKAGVAAVSRNADGTFAPSGSPTAGLPDGNPAPKSQSKSSRSTVRASEATGQSRNRIDMLVAARIEPMFAEAAKERKVEAGREGGKAGGRGRPKDGDRVEVIPPQPYPGAAPKKGRAPQARDEAAAALNVPAGTVGRALRLKVRNEIELAEAAKGAKSEGGKVGAQIGNKVRWGSGSVTLGDTTRSEPAKPKAGGQNRSVRLAADATGQEFTSCARRRSTSESTRRRSMEGRG